MKTTSPRSSTVLPTPTPTTSAGTPLPLFADDFTSNSKGWSVGAAPGYTRALQNDALTLSDTNHTVLVESLPTSIIFDDFSISTTFTLLQGDKHDSVGLYLRGDSNLDHDYRVDIFANNTYAISKEWLDSSNELEQTFLVHPSHTSSLKPKGVQNTLAIVMKGPTMVLLINGKVVHSITDTSYKRGQVALFVKNGPTSDGVTAAFQDVEIYSAAEDLSR